jgi:hypothetical protein
MSPDVILGVGHHDHIGARSGEPLRHPKSSASRCRKRMQNQVQKQSQRRRTKPALNLPKGVSDPHGSLHDKTAGQIDHRGSSAAIHPGSKDGVTLEVVAGVIAHESTAKAVVGGIRQVGGKSRI